MNVLRRCTSSSMGIWRMGSCLPQINLAPAVGFATLPNTGIKMLAWQIDGYGGMDRLKLVEKSMPIITKPDQILIKVHAASINYLDIRMRGGYGAKLLNRTRGISADGDELPLTLGRDCSGTIVDMGQRVKGFKEGDEVWATVNSAYQGSHAQYALVTSNDLSHKPSNISHVDAASIPYAAITAWSAIYAVAKVRPENAMDKRALVLGGSGGVGSFAVQLLKAWGADVTTTCSTEAIDFVSTLHPHNIVDYKKPTLESELSRLGPFDLIVDTVGGDTEQYAMKMLNKLKGSQYVTLITPFLKDIDKQGAVMGSLSASWSLFSKAMKASKHGGKYRWAFALPSQHALKEVAKLVEEERIKPMVEMVFPFTEMPSAFANIEARSARGKTVVNVVGQDTVQAPKTADFLFQ